MLSVFKKALGLLVVFTVITGVLYPTVITIAAQTFFNKQANGSLIEKNGKLVASKYIGQNFKSPEYFWSRPSETKSYPYNTMGAAGSNKSPASEEYEYVIEERIKELQKYHGDKKKIPVDLVTASASGIDPHISIDAAKYQMERVAKFRGITLEEIESIIDELKVERMFGFLGESYVNVVELNLALDYYGEK